MFGYVIELGAEGIVIGGVCADGQDCGGGFPPKLTDEVILGMGGANEFEGSRLDPHCSEHDVLVDCVNAWREISWVERNGYLWDCSF